MIRILRFSMLAVAIAAIGFSGCKTTNKLSTKEALLRFTPKKGDSFTMAMKMNMTMDGPQSMNMTMGMDSGLEVGEVAGDGAFYLDNVIKKVAMSMKSGMMNMDYDSANPNTDDPTAAEMHKTLGVMVDKNMVSKLSNRGELLEAPNYEEIFGNDPQLSGQIDQMNQSLKSSFITYPENVVKVGDSWDASMEVEGQVPMTQTYTYTVKEITLTDVILDVNGKIKLSPEAMVGGSGNITGSMVINRTDGFVKSSTMKQTLNMSVMGMEMKANTDVNVTMTKK